MDALANLGVDWKLFLAQAINFLVLLFILHRYAYRPMLAFLEERTGRIEKGLKDAEAATVKLADMEKKEKETLAQAHKEARVIVEAAEEAAKVRDTERLAETEARAKRFLEEAQMKIAEEKEKAIIEAKQEIGELVVLSVEKILREKVTKDTDNQLIASRLK